MAIRLDTPRRHTALGIGSTIAAVVGAVALAWWWTARSPSSERLPKAAPPLELAPPPRMAAASASTDLQVVTRQARLAASSPPQDLGVLFSDPDLFPDFQAAIDSSDKASLEAGLRAWRTCAGYVWLGYSDLEAWLTFVIPQGLERAEWDRRARHGRASARRCAGFAQQAGALAQAEAMETRARELGSIPARLRARMRERADQGERADASIVEESCNLLRSTEQLPPSAVRQITLALRIGAAARPEHFLNATSNPARNLGVNLALCDLDPQGCNAYSNYVGSACIQSGKCSYANEVDYWRGETKQDVWDASQPVRQQLVTAVRAKDCAALFR